MLRTFLAAIWLFGMATSARADGPACGMPEARSHLLALGHIADVARRTYFLLDDLEQAGCPAATLVCRSRSYLIPGNPVIVSGRRGDLFCASYTNVNGNTRTGWLPAANVVVDRDRPITVGDWVGHWSRREGDIYLNPDGRGKLAIEGEATFGSMDPERIKLGAVHEGQIDGRVTPTGGTLSFAMGDGTSLPVGEGDQYVCKVWMRRLGPWLVVDDNDACGGVNVTFRGIYVRKPR